MVVVGPEQGGVCGSKFGELSEDERFETDACARA